MELLPRRWCYGSECLLARTCHAVDNSLLQSNQVGFTKEQRKSCGRHKAIGSPKASFDWPIPQVMTAGMCTAAPLFGIFMVVSVHAVASCAFVGILSFKMHNCAAAWHVSHIRGGLLCLYLPRTCIVGLSSSRLHRLRGSCSCVVGVVVRFVGVVRTAAVDEGNMSLKGPQSAWALRNVGVGGREIGGGLMPGTPGSLCDGGRTLVCRIPGDLTVVGLRNVLSLRCPLMSFDW